jgi:outer membrane murein-binding lipoprotein Lpp
MAVPAFTTDQWLIVGLIFLLGIVLGMFLAAGGKWKARYREEVGRSETLEAENRKLRADAQEMDSLRHAAARDEAARRDAAAVRTEPLPAAPAVPVQPDIPAEPPVRREPPVPDPDPVI